MQLFDILSGYKKHTICMGIACVNCAVGSFISACSTEVLSSNLGQRTTRLHAEDNK
jgi:hypothetical protein